MEASPGRVNIFLGKVAKIKGRDVHSVYESIYQPEVDRLASDVDKYPVTLMYIPLDKMSEACAYAMHKLGRASASTARYSTLFSNQEEAARQIFVKELQKEHPRVRLFFCTSTISMGFDSPCVERVLHAKPPRNLSDYWQEIGNSWEDHD